MQLEVTGTSIDKITKAKLQIQNKIDKLRKEHWECEIPSAVLKLFIGKHGTNINKVSSLFYITIIIIIIIIIITSDERGEWR